jgi:hypothetical protein
MTPSKIFVVSMSTSQGPYGPTVSMTYHKTREEGVINFKKCVDSVCDDPSTVFLTELDGETMGQKVIDSYQGMGEDTSW